MKIIDYLYLNIYTFYEKKFKSDINEIYAISILVLLCFLHIIFYNKVIDFLGYHNYSFFLNKMRVIIIFILLYAFFGYRYGFLIPINELKEIKYFKNVLLTNKIYLLYLAFFFIGLIILLVK